jgi:hypothetical protein
MTNEQALTLLDEYVEAAAHAVLVGTWARAFLQETGGPTWDAVKDVARSGERLRLLGQKVAELETRYEEVISV